MAGAAPGSSSHTENYWLRIFYAVLFCVALHFATLLVIALTIIQILVVIFSNSPNPGLTSFMAQLGRWFSQVIAFIGFSSVEKPFPLGEWPSSNPLDRSGPLA